MLGTVCLNHFLNKSLPNVSFDAGIYRLGLLRVFQWGVV